MYIPFFKYQGTGNDFVIIDNRNKLLGNVSAALIKRLCHRRFGVGADGFMLLENHPDYDFEMVYYNSDGNQSSMCGNGGRCIVAFANSLGVSADKGTFLAVDGVHEFKIVLKKSLKQVSLKMIDVSEVEIDSFFYLNTGSPHFVVFHPAIDEIELLQEARKIRYNDRFKSTGTNVNFVEFKGDVLYVRTYERGVEDETLSCGTGVTAAALSAAIRNNQTSGSYKIMTKGGELEVFYNKTGKSAFNEIWLQGPAEFVFKGEIEI